MSIVCSHEKAIIVEVHYMSLVSMKSSGEIPCLLKFIVQGEEVQKLVETGQFRHDVPETGLSEHPY